MTDLKAYAGSAVLGAGLILGALSPAAAGPAHDGGVVGEPGLRDRAPHHGHGPGVRPGPAAMGRVPGFGGPVHLRPRPAIHAALPHRRGHVVRVGLHGAGFGPGYGVPLPPVAAVDAGSLIVSDEGFVPSYPMAGITYGAAPSYAAPIYNRPNCFCY